MKNNFSIISLFAITMAVFASCTKKENKVEFEGGVSPVLKSSVTTPIVLLSDDKEKEALTLSWTNPGYKFNTGLSSQNVNYILQFDSTGKNFSSSKMQEQSIPGDLSRTLTVKEINTFLSKMEFAPLKQHTVDIRIKSTLNNNATALFSNAITMKFTSYLDFAVEPPGTSANNYDDGNLWVTGDCFPSPDWANPLPAPHDADLKFTKIDKLHYERIVDFDKSGGYKMIQQQGVWGTQYHALEGSSAAALEGSFEKRDADPQFPSPGSGKYKIEVNFQSGKYKLTKQ